jgi:hypothetical protein
MRILVHDAAAARELAAALTAAGCETRPDVSGSTLEISRREHLVTAAELLFFLRAWLAAHPHVEVELASS